MKPNPNLSTYSQSDIETLYASGSISPNIDQYSNLSIENSDGKMYGSCITIPLQNVVYNEIKVKTKVDVLFRSI